MTVPRPVALLCDATASTGLGHLSRTVALGEALAELGAAPTVVGVVDPSFAAVLDGAGVALHPVRRPLGAPGATEERLAALAAQGSGAVVVDSYRVDAAEVAALTTGRASLVVDDFARLPSYPCDLVLNFTVRAPDLPYPPHPGLLLGPAWFLARRPLRALRAAAPPPRTGRVERALVAIGGADASGTTAAVVEALVAVAPHLAIDVVAGRALPEGAAIDRLLGGAGPGSALTVGAPSLVPHLAAAHLVVCGGGLTKYEAAYVGRPAAVVDQTADQADETAAFAARGLAVALGTAAGLGPGGLADRLAALLADHDGRDRLAAAGRAAFPADPTLDAARRLLATP